MRGRSSYQPPGISAAGKTYGEVFVRRARKLLALGYTTLTPGDFANAEEEAITGELTSAVESVLDNPSAPQWMGWFSIHEEPRVHDRLRTGKRRRRLDIRIDSSQAKPRARFCFEAKRLGPNHGASVYLGHEGLRCFLDGRYAHDDPAAGMLGYVQAGKPYDWAARIQAAIERDATEFGLLRSSPWRRERIAAGLSDTYRSGHNRPSVGTPVEIYHTLLRFN